MARVRVGVFILCFAVVPAAFAKSFHPDVQTVYYDVGSPDRSVALIDGEIVESGQWIDHYQVIRFTPKTVIFKDQVSQDTLQIPLGSAPTPEKNKFTREVFVVKQLKAIYRAQTKYYNHYRKTYADHLDKLINAGYLDGGFKDGVKAGYRFEITDVGKTPDYSLDFERQPTFTAEARPVYPVSGDYYFSVDYLGDVRFSDKLELLSWAPVWDYDGHQTVDVKDISVDGGHE